MRIFIDCTHTAKHKYKNTGIHRVVRELTSELSKITLDKPNIEIVPVMFDNHFMRRVVNLNSQEYNYFTKNNFYANAIIKIFRKLQKIFYRVQNKLLNLLIPVFNWLNLNGNKRNVVLEFENSPIQPEDIYIIADANWDLPKTYYKFLQNLRRSKVTIVLISYDLIPIKFPEFSSKNFTQAFTLFYQEYSSLCDQVLCISKNSAEDYKTAIKQGILANSNPDLIVKSFRLGCNYSFRNVSQDRNVKENDFKPEFREILNKQYILVVGSLVPHKNIKTIIAAFDLLLSSNYQNINLIFAGNKGWHSETDIFIESHEMCGKFIHILGSVTDVQLRVLYENCYCLVQAS
ncbi:glycosyltransferase, partial [Nodularia sp. UHCC 0506]|uniref:glycosyltransferase n=1 Tax=Nodularia sp. UHCC 0506 TaxID=3110243 RepID=UPI002B218175